jgi:FtsP/CotA-like multicopper oxidase with cupredoxin domain
MKSRLPHAALLLAAVGLAVRPAGADVAPQCPGDLDGDGLSDNPDIVCWHLTAGDGIINMADDQRRLMYMFGFNDVTGVMPQDVMMEGMLAANFPSPTIVLREGQELYLSLTNVGMFLRPDLEDPHSIHFHGFPNAAPVFDGVPEASIVIKMGSTMTYYYNIVHPGTYIWHCHVEATEHMQMGMLGNLYVLPAQDGIELEFPPGSGRTYTKFCYNDGDGSTGYDVTYPLQVEAFDPAFHDASLGVQPLPFADMLDTYPMLNGRGYPDTVNPDPLLNTADDLDQTPRYSQLISSLIEARQGERILLRFSCLAQTRFYTLTSPNIPMQVIGRGAQILRGPDPDGEGGLPGQDLSFWTSSITIGGGETRDVLLDTANVPPGRYFLYSAELHQLSNDLEDFGGLMTEIVVSAPPPAQDPPPSKPGRPVGNRHGRAPAQTVE